jgi:hypothetical protein
MGTKYVCAICSKITALNKTRNLAGNIFDLKKSFIHARINLTKRLASIKNRPVNVNIGMMP